METVLGYKKGENGEDMRVGETRVARMAKVNQKKEKIEPCHHASRGCSLGFWPYTK